MKEKLLELKSKRDFEVLICEKESKFTDISSFMEVSIDIDYDTFSIKEKHYCIKTSEKDTLARWTSKPQEYVSEESLKAADLFLEKQLRKIKREVYKGRKSAAYKAAKKEFLSYIEHWKTDFYFHDALFLGRYDPQKFMWTIRKTGTHLIYERSSWYNAVLKSDSENRDARYFWFENGKLEEITKPEVQSYYEKLERAKE